MPLSSASDKSTPPRTMPLSSAFDKYAPLRTMPLSSTSDKSLPLCHQWKNVSFHPRLLPLTKLSSYDASSCAYNTYKISIQKNSFWSRNNSKSLAKILKGFPWKWFCKNLCHLLCCAHILNSEVLFYNMFP